jgi:hypothetical protein
MLALAQQSCPTPAAAAAAGDDGQWLSLAEAASRCGQSATSTWRRRIGQLHAAGHARLQKPAAGGKAQWFIHVAADARLQGHSPAPAVDELDLPALTDAQRQVLLSREHLVQQWDRQHAAGMQPQAFCQMWAVAHGTKPSITSLYRWHAAWRQAGRAGLMDERWSSARNQDQGSDPFLAAARDIYLKPHGPSMRLTWQLVCHLARQHQWPLRSAKATQRFLAKLPRAQVISARQGPDAFEAACVPSIRRDYSTLAANEVWNSDHHRLDVMVRAADGRHFRPWLTCWQDVRSRKITGWRMIEHAPNADTILASFVSAAQVHGVPGTAYVDNGRDYDSRAMQGQTKRQRRAARALISPDQMQRMGGAMGELGVTVMHAWPYHGQSKPIERFFNTLADRFCRAYPSYTGPDTARKPEGLAEACSANRAPTLQQLREDFAAWLAGDYNAAEHTGQGMDGRSPEVVFEAELRSRRTLPLETLRFACLPLICPQRTLKSGQIVRGFAVGKEGIRYQGVSYGGFDPHIQRLVGRYVQLKIDADDVSQVYVLNLDGQLIGPAKSNVTLPFLADKRDMAAAISAKGQIRKAIKDYHKSRRRVSYDVAQLMVARAADAADASQQQQQGPRLAGDAPISPVRTSFDQQLPAIRQAFQAPLKQAVGAENIEPPTPFSYQRRPASDDDQPIPFSYQETP